MCTHIYINIYIHVLYVYIYVNIFVYICIFFLKSQITNVLIEIINTRRHYYY